MPARKGTSARAPQEHLGLCYGQTCAGSMVPRSRGREYTFAQARELVLDAVIWLHRRGWSNPDAMDLHNYGPRLQEIGMADLQRIIDELVRTQDLTFTVITPPHCRRPRRCYSASHLDYWDIPGGVL